uniref:C2H2-type domain-containing protein n=1 Tax=Timema monikensis TaxID=170555 RepID=A0A7R9HKQ7_9NEOP|nr:unnamed protein product [Timema monikensis]
MGCCTHFESKVRALEVPSCALLAVLGSFQQLRDVPTKPPLMLLAGYGLARRLLMISINSDSSRSHDFTCEHVKPRDSLPKAVCLDCCTKLDQCSHFHESSLQAQLTLQMIFLPKLDHVVQQHLTSIGKVEDVLQQTQPVEFNHFDHDTSSMLGEEKNKDGAGLSSLVAPSKRKCRTPVRCAQDTLDAKKEPADQVRVEEEEDEEDEEYLEEEEPLSSRKRRDGWDKFPWRCTDCPQVKTLAALTRMKYSYFKVEPKLDRFVDSYRVLYGQELPSMQALRSHHQEVHKQTVRFLCIQCKKVYTKYYGFVSHVRRHKNHMKFCINCEECGKCFSNKKVLESHRATHSDARPYVCSECGKAFRQQSALYVHNRSHQPDEVKNKYPCDQCDKKFSTKPNLVTHKRIHTGIRNYTCDQCGKSFIQKGNLDAHLLTHSSDKPHTCTICNKGFKTPLQLRKHQTVHTGAKPHQCDVCGRQFRERGTLREHHRIHTGAMPFTCEFCGKAFRFKGILTLIITNPHPLATNWPDSVPSLLVLILTSLSLVCTRPGFRWGSTHPPPGYSDHRGTLLGGDIE